MNELRLHWRIVEEESLSREGDLELSVEGMPDLRVMVDPIAVSPLRLATPCCWAEPTPGLLLNDGTLALSCQICKSPYPVASGWSGGEWEERIYGRNWSKLEEWLEWHGLDSLHATLAAAELADSLSGLLEGHLVAPWGQNPLPRMAFLATLPTALCSDRSSHG